MNRKPISVVKVHICIMCVCVVCVSVCAYACEIISDFAQVKCKTQLSPKSINGNILRITGRPCVKHNVVRMYGQLKTFSSTNKRCFLCFQRTKF